MGSADNEPEKYLIIRTIKKTTARIIAEKPVYLGNEGCTKQLIQLNKPPRMSIISNQINSIS
jgi:hypothetical protein